MFLISWNVAGWSATSAAIRESYGSLQAFFLLTGADIICLQECKGTWSKLETSPVEMGAADPPMSKRPKVAPLVLRDGEPAIPLQTVASPSPASSSGGVPGWESFWALSGKAHRGFNGVVTFVKKSLTLACDNRPFADDTFNDEGRVVVTYHSQFTLVNVYVPNARGGARSDYKRNFLTALRQEVLPRLRRESKKPVVLVGDLNCTYRAEDAHWTFRRLHLPHLLELHTLAHSDMSDVAWHRRFPRLPKPTLERVVNLAVNTVCASLLPNDDGSGDTGLMLMAPVALDLADGETSSTVSPLSEAVVALRRTLEESGKTRRQLLLSTESPPTTLKSLIDVGLLSVHAADMTKSFPPSFNEDLFTVVQHTALAPHGDESVEFLGRLLQVPVVMSVTPDFTTGELFSPPGDDASKSDIASTTRMWDTFLLTDTASTDPADRTTAYCPCPFTVWDQSKNRRLTNEGSRIDFILVDDALRPLVVTRRNTENNTGLPRKGVCVAGPSTDASANVPCLNEDFFSELRGKSLEDGIHRAMGGGAYPGASYDKSGIPPLADAARGVPFRGLPSTGLFVTPPQFSDHAGVCVLFSEKDEDGASFTLSMRPGKLVERSGKCMYRPPVGLQSFFRKSAPETDVASPHAMLMQQTPSAASEPPQKAPRTDSCATATDVKTTCSVVEISSDDE